MAPPSMMTPALLASTVTFPKLSPGKELRSWIVAGLDFGKIARSKVMVAPLPAFARHERRVPVPLSAVEATTQALADAIRLLCFSTTIAPTPNEA